MTSIRKKQFLFVTIKRKLYKLPVKLFNLMNIWGGEFQQSAQNNKIQLINSKSNGESSSSSSSSTDLIKRFEMNRYSSMTIIIIYYNLSIFYFIIYNGSVRFVFVKLFLKKKANFE